jgi:hypothetical protein
MRTNEEIKNRIIELINKTDNIVKSTAFYSTTYRLSGKNITIYGDGDVMLNGEFLFVDKSLFNLIEAKFTEFENSTRNKQIEKLFQD